MKDFTKIPVYLKNVPPPAETFNHIEFLEFLAKWVQPDHYLELGVRSGVCFSKLSRHAKYSTGVDTVEPSPLVKSAMQTNSNINYFKGTTDEYFNSKIKTTFDLVFIDADHSYEQCLKDFLNVKDKVVKNGFVILHDTYPYSKKFMEEKVRGDCYKVPMYIRENLHSEWELVTLPFNPGLTIAKKSPGSDIWY
mgnify:CR=1 FL=1